MCQRNENPHFVTFQTALLPLPSARFFSRMSKNALWLDASDLSNCSVPWKELLLHTPATRCIALTVCAHRQNNTYADDHLLLVINVLFKNLDTHIRKCRENSVDFSPSLHDENDGGLQNATADAKCQCCQLKDFNMDMDYTCDGSWSKFTWIEHKRDFAFQY